MEIGIIPYQAMWMLSGKILNAVPPDDKHYLAGFCFWVSRLWTCSIFPNVFYAHPIVERILVPLTGLFDKIIHPHN